MRVSHLCSVALIALALLPADVARADEVRIASPDATKKNDFYLGNRAPLVPSPLVKLPIGAIQPRGWLRKELTLEAAGFFGQLAEISRFLKKDGNAWLSPAGEGQSPWEEVPYWLKGFGDLGYVLGDRPIIDQARPWIEAALASQREDGYFGPRANLTGKRAKTPGKPDVWPHMVMLNALESYHEYSGDPRVLRLMTRFFRWEMNLPEADFLLPYWQQQRGADNLASVYWLYNRTGEAWLLELAKKIYRRTADWTSGIPNWHNVNICQAFRGPEIFYQQSKDPAHRLAADRNYRTVRDLYGQVPGGLFGGDENCRPGYSDPRQGVETCGIVEMMHSCEMLLAIDGDLTWADRCEDAAFNSLPAATTPDVKALRYLTCPNQVVSDRTNKSPGVQDRGPMFLYDPHIHRCCQHNMGQGWPYYAERLWMATPGNGLAAVFYCASEVTAKAGDGTEVTITESTSYPFDETVELKLSMPRSVRFPLYLRIPGWCDAARVAVNGKPAQVQPSPQSYVLIDRPWNDGDRVRLELPAEVQVTTWTRNKGSVSVSRGPLTYALAIGEKYVTIDGPKNIPGIDPEDPRAEELAKKWPACEVFPTTPWNYGLVLDHANPAGSFEFVKHDRAMPEDAFRAESPIELRAKAKRIPAWTVDQNNLCNVLQESPVRSDQPEETVRLVPMGCARLRISAFPVIGEGAEAHNWSRPPAQPVTASHCFEHDSVVAVADALLPTSSDDHSIPRMTWWPNRGSQEWIQVSFDQPRKVSAVAVYWYDDTGRGRCRVPQSWSVEWLDGQTWKPVAAAGRFGVERDRFNETRFDAVVASALRLDVQLRPDFSAGILEWQVKE